jgi:NitT/TauT family transport system ATP-binding protein
MAHVVLEDVSLAYQRTSDASTLLALDRVGLTVESGEFVAIVGPSGCGKSSLLLLINGLLRPTSGRILVNDRPFRAPSADRALVFQEFALLPWRTVLKNVELAPELRRQSTAQRRATARQNIARVGLSSFEHYFPHQLSGGMRQRVGIARALSADPELLLMDEPFGALDAQTRQLMATELLEIWERDRKTILFVTHDIDEAVFLGDRVVVLSAGPGRILDELRIELPRPRDPAIRDSPRFIEYRRRIRQRLEHEVRESVERQLSAESVAYG